MPSTNTLRALIEAANFAARAMAQRRAAAGLGKKADDLLQIELFPPPEVVGGVSIPAPRLGASGALRVPSGPVPRAGEPSFVTPVPPGPPPAPAPFRDLIPPVARSLPRAPRQLDLLTAQRAPRTRGDVALREATQAMLPPELAATVENIAGGLARQYQRRLPKDVGPQRSVTPEDITQEILRLTQARLQAKKLPTSPADLARYLASRASTATQKQVEGLTRPVRIPAAERRIMNLEDRIRTAMQRDPRFAAFDPTPGAVFRRLAKDPGFAKLLRREGGVRYFGTPSGVERTLAMGPVSGVRDPKTLRTLTSSGASPLDELLAKTAAPDVFTAPMARMELALQALTERQREIVTRVLGLGRPKEGIREIGRELKIAHPTVIEHYKAGMKRLEAAAKTKPAVRPPAAAPAPVPSLPKKTAKELVEDFLREAKRRVEARRRWEVEAPLRRMREQEPVRTWQRRTIPGETFLPTGKGRLQ